MAETFRIGDHVNFYLDSKFGMNEGWYEGAVVRIDPYSEHRNFYWVELNEDAQAILNIKQISVFNPKNMKKLKLDWIHNDKEFIASPSDSTPRILFRAAA